MSKVIVNSITTGVDRAQGNVIKNWCVMADTDSGIAFLIGNPNSYQLRHNQKMRSFDVPAHFSKSDARRIARTITSVMENYEQPTMDDVDDIIARYIRHHVDFSINKEPFN